MNERTGELLAVKQLSLAEGTKAEVMLLRKEIQVMWNLSHENIVRLIIQLDFLPCLTATPQPPALETNLLLGTSGPLSQINISSSFWSTCLEDQSKACFPSLEYSQSH